MNNENFINLIKRNIWFIGKRSSIDLIYTIRRYLFKYTFPTGTGLSGHHHLISSMMKAAFGKEQPQVLTHWDCKNSNLKQF